MNNRPASWRFPTQKQLDRERARDLLAGPPPSPEQDSGPAGDPPSSWWNAVLDDPRARARPAVPVEAQQLIDIRQEVLRVECLRCFRIVEIQMLDAIKLYGPGSIWGRVREHLLESGCQHRTGNRDEDGCWASR